MRSLVYAINKISDWSSRFIFFIPWLITAIIVWEVILRSIFNQPTIWAHESSVMLFGAFCILGGAYALRHRAHVNMDLVYGRLSSRGQAILDTITFPLLFAFCGVLLWQGAAFAWRSIALGETSQSYWSPIMWPVKSTIAIGGFLILLQGMGKFISDFYTAITGKEIE